MSRLSGVIALLLVLILSGCGFQLRQEISLPLALSPMSIEGVAANSPLARDLIRSLEAGGARVVAAGEPSSSRLLIPLNDLNREVLSVGESARVREFMLRYLVEFELLDGAGEVVVPLQRVELIREFSFDDRQALGAASEEALLREEMQREMGRRVLDQLQRALQARSG